VRTYANGDRWEGYWKSDRRHGPGTDILAHGEMLLHL
jgi:hypothetical protein